ncbi:UNVERIFIED_ORG: hypothetical protein J2R93_007831 [Bradyrhizobium japonicum]
MNEVHCPGLIDPTCFRPVFTQLDLDATLRRFVAQLQAQFPIKTIGTFDIDGPAVTLEQDVDPAISVSHPRLADVLDPALESGLVATLGLVDVKCAIDPKSRTGPPDRDLPVTPYFVDKLSLAARLQSFFESTS